jgi:hypothetical protein
LFQTRDDAATLPEVSSLAERLDRQHKGLPVWNRQE